jgi:hypothetical protein
LTRAPVADGGRATAHADVSTRTAVVEVISGVDLAARRSDSIAVSEAWVASALSTRADRVDTTHVAADTAVVGIGLSVGAPNTAACSSTVSARVARTTKPATNAFSIRAGVRGSRTIPPAKPAVVEVSAQIAAARAAAATGAVCARHESRLGATIACSAIAYIRDDQSARLIALNAAATTVKHAAREIRGTCA